MSREGEKEVIAIMCVDRNWGLGRNGRLLFPIPEDMRYFREKTMGNVVIMGRKTLEALPGGKPLKGRTNIVLSSSGSREEAEKGGYILCRSKEDLFEEIRKYDGLDKYVIGGGSVYRELLPYCRYAEVTRVDAEGDADVYAPDLTKENYWITRHNKSNPVVYEETEGGYRIAFETFTNLNPVNYPEPPHFLELECRTGYGEEPKKRRINLSHIARLYADPVGRSTIIELDVPKTLNGSQHKMLYVDIDYMFVYLAIQNELTYGGQYADPFFQ